jgi:hypothetical protein
MKLPHRFLRRHLIFVIILANLIKRFSRVPQQLLAWSERKLTAESCATEG